MQTTVLFFEEKQISHEMRFVVITLKKHEIKCLTNNPTNDYKVLLNSLNTS